MTNAFRLTSALLPVRRMGVGVLCFVGSCFTVWESFGAGQTPQLTVHRARKVLQNFQKSPPKRRDEHGPPKPRDEHGVLEQHAKGFREI